MKTEIIAVVGPTGSGKTDLAIRLAKAFNGEIICADSRTIYKGLDIGTAKPTKEEQQGIRHYGLDLVEPDDSFSAAEFQKLAEAWLKDIKRRAKLAIIVGGTGLYVDGLLYGFHFGKAANPEYRKSLESLSLEALQHKLLDAGIELPENSKNKRYLIRAIEQGGINRSKSKLRDNTKIIGLDPGKEVLEQRIISRSVSMQKNGVIEEAEWLFNNFGYDCAAVSGNIYRALKPYFVEDQPLIECMGEFVRLDKKLAKRQRTWFKRNLDVQWFEHPNLAVQFLSSEL